MDHPFHTGYITLVGKPNVGKSTLMNRFLQQKLAIVTPKPQTTRHRILGIINNRDYQIIFLDTPGLMQPKYLLQETMVKTAQNAIYDGDIILLVVDTADFGLEDERIIDLLRTVSKPKFLVMNKIDRLNKDHLLPLIDQYSKRELFKEIIPISALRNQGVDRLLSLIIRFLPEGEPYFPQEMISDNSERFFVAEIIREQVFLRYHNEIPYSTAVHIEHYEENPGRKDYIVAIVTVERNSQKSIIIGKRGNSLKTVGEAARAEIEHFLQRPVFLKLEVRVREKWRKNPSTLREMGYL